MTNQTTTPAIESTLFTNDKVQETTRLFLNNLKSEGSANRAYLLRAIELSPNGENDYENFRSAVITQLNSAKTGEYPSTAKSTVSKIIKVAKFIKENATQWESIKPEVVGLQQAYTKINNALKAFNDSNDSESTESKGKGTEKTHEGLNGATESGEIIKIPFFMQVLCKLAENKDSDMYGLLYNLSVNPEKAGHLFDVLSDLLDKDSGIIDVEFMEATGTENNSPWSALGH